MPYPSPNTFALFPIQEVIFNPLDGTPLAGGSVGFYSDPLFTILKTVYQQSQAVPGTFTPLENPILLDGIGSYADETGTEIIPFLFPYSGTGTPSEPDPDAVVELYYIQVLDANGNLVFTRMDWPPNQPDLAGPPVTELTQSENLLTNPQFNEVLFQTSGPQAITVSGTNLQTAIAPGWWIQTSGSGTVTLTQNALGVVTPSGAPWSLSILLGGGITTATLYQRIYQSPRLGISGYLSGYIEVASSTSVPLTLNYIPSGPSGSPTTQVIIDTFSSPSDGQYVSFMDCSAAPVGQNNTDAPSGLTAGYVDISLTMPAGANISVTSVQVLSVPDPDTVEEFIQISTPEQQAQMFWYWQQPLNYKPIPSYLTGWDFPLNPAQPLTSTVSAQTFAPGNSGYIWDQTILFATTDATLTFARDSATNGFTVIGSSTPTTFALVQYLSATQAREIFSQNNSVKIRGLTSSGTIVGTVSLYSSTDSTLPVLTASSGYSLVSTVTTGVSPAAPTSVVGGGGNHGNWVIVPRSGLGNSPTFQLNSAASDFDFSGWRATSSVATAANWFAIVLAFNTLETPQNVILEYVSLVAGDIPTRPAPQTPDDVLRECQYYYETSYDINTAIGSATSVGAPTAPQMINNPLNGTIYFITNGFVTPYSLKRAIPSLTYYAVDGTVNTITANVQASGGALAQSNLNASSNIITPLSYGFWTYSPNTKYNSMTITSTTKLSDSPSASGTYGTAFITYNFTADARLGLF